MLKIKLWGLDSLVIYIVNRRTKRYNEMDFFIYLVRKSDIYNECNVKYQNTKKRISNSIRELFDDFTSYNIGI